MWQLSEAIDGMSEAWPGPRPAVIGGNVSLYNESYGKDIDPTRSSVPSSHRAAGRPAAGHLPGRRARWSCWTPASGRSAPATTRSRCPGSRWAVELRHHRNGTLPSIDLAGHSRLVDFVAALVAEGVAGGEGLVQGIQMCRWRTRRGPYRVSVRSGIGVQVSGWPTTTNLFCETPSG